MYSEYGGELSGYVYSQERNTVDCLKFVRLLNDLGVVVCFEEQGIYTNQPGAEFYITIYGCIAQSESENISANVKWGKARSAKEGNVRSTTRTSSDTEKEQTVNPKSIPTKRKP